MVIPPGKRRRWLVFRSWFYPVISVSDTWKTSKKGKNDNKKKLCSPLKHQMMERRGEERVHKSDYYYYYYSDAGDNRHRQQHRTSCCCSHSFASFRKYPSVEDEGKRKVKTPIRVAAVEKRRRETVKQTPCAGALSWASCCLQEPTELWDADRCQVRETGSATSGLRFQNKGAISPCAFITPSQSTQSETKMFFAPNLTQTRHIWKYKSTFYSLSVLTWLVPGCSAFTLKAESVVPGGLKRV